MEKRKKRSRGPNWNHAHTMAVAELKREASLNKEDGPLVWERIAQTLSSRFPGQIRAGDQCRRRWDTLVKVYNHIEDYCVVTGAQDHRELDEGELASMELATAYQQDWYDIVEQVCSQRKRKERCDRDLMLAKRSKGSVELPERPSNRDNLCSASTSKSVTYHEQSTPESTTTYAQVSSSPSLKADKLSPEEEVPRLKNGNDGLVLEAMQLRQHGQVSHEVSQEPQTLESANLLPHTFPAENGAQLKEPLQDDLWALVDAMPFETSTEIEQPDTESELTEPFDWYLEAVGLAAQPKEPLEGRVSPKFSFCLDEGAFSSEQSTLDSDWGEPLSLRKPPQKRERSVHVACRWLGTVSSEQSTLDSDWGKPLSLRKPPQKREGSVHMSMLADCRLGGSGRMSVVAGGRRFGVQEPVRHCKSRSGDSTISRQSRRWSLKVILLKIRQCCHACGRKETAENMEMESKQAARLQEKARKKALMSRKENVPAMLDAASRSTSATSATRGDEPLQKDSQRTAKQAALVKKEEETMTLKAERQQLGGKSSTKCVPIGKLCAKWSRKLFPAFHGQSSH